MELIGEKKGAAESSRGVSFPPAQAGGTTGASLPASELVASLRHSSPLLSVLYSV